MSSDAQSILHLLFQSNYQSVAIVTAVIYDYVLTFSNEIEYIWCRPWTWVSIMFFLVRYIGLCWMFSEAFFGSSFLPGPVETYAPESQRKHGIAYVQTDVSTVMALLYYWPFLVFLAAADLVMILRVYAIWNRSKMILWILLCIYGVQTISLICVHGIYDNPNTHFSVSVIRVHGFSFCTYVHTHAPPMLYMYASISQFVLSATLLIFAVVQTIKQSLEMYRATKRWQPNRYMQLLVRDGIVYFMVNTLNNITGIIEGHAPTMNSDVMAALFLICTISMACMMPRFIISVRELYERDLRERWQGIDSGFGVLSQPGVGPNTVLSGIASADVHVDQEGQMVGSQVSNTEGSHLETLGDAALEV